MTETSVLLAAGTSVPDDPAYDVGEGPNGTVRITGGPGPLSLRFTQGRLGRRSDG